jgi:hypothetical protein
MPKTRAELITQCLTNLGVIAEGQSVSDNDVSKMDKIVDPAISELSALDIYYVQDAGSIGPADGNIEDAAFLSIAAYIANASCAAFNLAADTKMQALSQLAEAKLRTLAAPARSLRTLRIDPALRPRRYGYYTGGFK